jgi:DNA ligase D-like protein (predicted 3'-phosphoesterase)
MATKQDPLGPYRGKRDLTRTPEPSAGRKRRAGAAVRGPQARRHHSHYDFRLEATGVLKSWAVPKGPSTNPKDKRLAMPTEDHPLDYADFEGLIPEGQYGAGPVIVWDTGTYRSLTEQHGKTVPVERAVQDGHVAVWLEGRKLRGGYALTRIGRGKHERWLLVKMADEDADPRRKPVKSQPESVVSGRTVEQVAAEAETGEDRGG